MRRNGGIPTAALLAATSLVAAPALLPAQATGPRPQVIGPDEGHLQASPRGVEVLFKVGTVSTGSPHLFFAKVTMPPGDESPTHLHEIDEELIYVLEGELTVTLDGEEHTVGPGGTVPVPPGAWMKVANRTDAPVVAVGVLPRGELEECYRVDFSMDADEAARREANEICRIRYR